MIDIKGSPLLPVFVTAWSSTHPSLPPKVGYMGVSQWRHLPPEYDCFTLQREGPGDEHQDGGRHR